MTEHDEHDEHDEHRRRLVRADPAAGLPPLRPAHLDALLEDIMSTPTGTGNAPTPTPTPTATTAPRRRFRGTLVGVAAAAVLVGGGVAVVLSQQQTPAPVAAATALTLPAAGGPSAMCAELTPEFLGASATAFAGTVESVESGTVTLKVTERFAGGPGDTVTVAQGTGSVVDGAALTFQDGGSYLIAADESGVISECGGSGPDDAALRALYTAAFPR